MGFKLVVAGSGKDYESINRVADMCRKVGAEYVGDVKGTKKAELLAGARGFLFPTKVDEAFGLGMVEALMSGTPVICSDRGACPEIISPDVGFVCRNENDYVAAINDVLKVNRHACREKAMKEFHYLRMAADYFVRQGREADELAGELASATQRRRYIAEFYGHRFWATPGAFTREQVDFMTEPFADPERLRAGWGNYESAMGTRPLSEPPRFFERNPIETVVLYGPEDHVIQRAFPEMCEYSSRKWCSGTSAYLKPAFSASIM